MELTLVARNCVGDCATLPLTFKLRFPGDRGNEEENRRVTADVAPQSIVDALFLRSDDKPPSSVVADAPDEDFLTKCGFWWVVDGSTPLGS